MPSYVVFNRQAGTVQRRKRLPDASALQLIKQDRIFVVVVEDDGVSAGMLDENGDTVLTEYVDLPRMKLALGTNFDSIKRAATAAKFTMLAPDDTE